ncbi:hypothetical protein RFI_27379, partial [Reticulomyxa filosa]
NVNKIDAETLFVSSICMNYNWNDHCQAVNCCKKHLCSGCGQHHPARLCKECCVSFNWTKCQKYCPDGKKFNFFFFYLFDTFNFIIIVWRAAQNVMLPGSALIYLILSRIAIVTFINAGKLKGVFFAAESNKEANKSIRRQIDGSRQIIAFGRKKIQPVVFLCYVFWCLSLFCVVCFSLPLFFLLHAIQCSFRYLSYSREGGENTCLEFSYVQCVVFFKKQLKEALVGYFVCFLPVFLFLLLLLNVERVTKDSFEVFLECIYPLDGYCFVPEKYLTWNVKTFFYYY